MRLTLRTLLAYLDNTLEPQDAEALRQKLSESGFATQLVQRIQGSLTASLPAPSPEAVSPVEEANVIGEYLDSTLPTEQVAEIERACLESGPHLAEAAACHQILTMALGESADVSQDLRKRIYALPDRELKDIATAPSFSGLSIPAERSSPLDASPDDLLTVDAAVTASEPVTPVGVNDSGVSDAPTRLREAEAVAAAMGHKIGVPKKIDEAKMYGGSIRTSRIAPWLVSLALVAALAFAMVQIFEPLWNPQEVADRTGTSDVIDDTSNDDDNPDPDADSSLSATDDSVNPEDEGPTDDGESMAPPPPQTTGASATGTPADADESGETDSTGSTDSSDPNNSSDPADSSDPTGTAPAMDDASVTSDETITDDVEPVPPPPPVTTETPTDAGTEPGMDDVDATAPPVPPPADAMAEESPEVEATTVATLASESALVAAQVGDVWEHLRKDDLISTGIKLFVAPTFRADFATDAAQMTFVGPATMQWIGSEDAAPALQIQNGQVLIQSNGAEAVVHLRLDDQPISLRLEDEESRIALSVQYYRAPGLDPLIAENRRLLAGVLVLQGAAELTFEGQTSNLVAGQQWTKKGSAEPQTTAVEAVPPWSNVEEIDSLVREAQEGLLSLIEDAEPLEIELREARLFRRAEVGALAARTLLGMGYGDVYFGGDGILSDAKQRSYWFEHFTALQRVVNQDEESALNLRAAIVEMDSANALSLFRLLTGFSQTQLVEGGDEELVGLLDSSSMSVRVLALENLEAITGTTLYFRPEQENAVRREPGIKKWIVRQRKGDIRWQQ